MKKRMFSVLLCLCMVMALLPTTVLAASNAPETVKVGGIELTDGKYLATNDATTASTYTEGDSYVALYKDGVLTLNGLNITKDTQCVWWEYDVSGKHDLTIELAEGTTNTLVRTNGSAINGESGFGSGPSLTIQGNGTLNVTGSSYGIWVWEDVIIQGGATVNATGTSEAGISNNCNAGKIIVKPGANVTATGGKHGVRSDNNRTGSLSVQGGSFTAIGGEAALGMTADFGGNSVYVGDDAAHSAAWNTVTPLTDYKYITAHTSVENVTFGYAYDAQRWPAFPSQGNTIELSDLRFPLLSDGNHGTRSDGSWTLTRVGTYSYMDNNRGNFANANFIYLASIVRSVSEQYTLDENAIVIHELKDGSMHVAYGVVIAYDAANGYAVFLGDTWGGGAGYLLSTTSKSDSFDATAGVIATDFVQSCSIFLDMDNGSMYTFEPVTEGYIERPSKVVTVTNNGTQPTGPLTVSLSGGSSFELSSNTIDSITETNGTATFTVAPTSGLSAATYTDTVIVSGTNIVSKSFQVKITVNPAGTYTVTFNANGYGTAPAPQTVPCGSSAVEPAAPTADGYTFGGWYTDAACTSAWNFATPVTANITLYARWTYTGGSSDGGSYTPPSYKVDTQLPQDADGRVSADCTTAKQGDKVTITVTPDRYYKVDGVVVKDRNGKKISVTENADGTFSFKMPAGKVTVEPIFSWDNPFADVAEDAYYAPAVEWALKNDITGGTTAATFGPNAGCTRAQIVTFLWRAAGSPAPKSGTMPFDDVAADAYYHDAVLWAMEQGITTGTSDTTFSPDAICTRSQSMTFLYHAAGSPGTSDSVVFSDVAAGSYYADAVVWAAQNGVTSGTGNGEFSPNANCTRAQIMTFLYRWLVK